MSQNRLFSSRGIPYVMLRNIEDIGADQYLHLDGQILEANIPLTLF